MRQRRARSPTDDGTGQQARPVFYLCRAGLTGALFFLPTSAAFFDAVSAILTQTLYDRFRARYTVSTVLSSEFVG